MRLAEEAARLQQALGEAGFENDPIGFLLSTPSELAIVNQEDLTGETEQQNLPGSTWQYPNWRQKDEGRGGGSGSIGRKTWGAASRAAAGEHVLQM